MPELSDDHLAAILASVGDHLVVPAGSSADALTSTLPPSNGSSPEADETDDIHDLDDADDTPPTAGRWTPRVRRLALVAAAVAIVVTVVGATVAPVREAVADWLGIGSTEVVRVGQGDGQGDPSDLPYLGDDLVPVDRAAAERRLGAQLPDTSRTELGPAPVLAVPPEGGVIMAWDDGATTLWVRRSEQPPGTTVTKLVTLEDRLERIDGLGDEAAIIEGPHVLGTPQRRLAAGTVLVWVDGGFEHRLESDLDPDQMVEIAHAIDRR